MFVGSNDEGLVRVFELSILDGVDDNGAAGAVDEGGAMKRDAVNSLSYFRNVSGGGSGAGRSATACSSLPLDPVAT